MSETVKIKLTQNVMFGGAHHAAGEVLSVVNGVAEQLRAQGLGVVEVEAESAGPATSEPEPKGKERAMTGPRAKQGSK